MQRVGRAERPRNGQRRLLAVDDDDSGAVGEDGALDDVDADAARPNHGHDRAFRDLRRVQHGSDPRDHGAADRGEGVERHVVGTTVMPVSGSTV